MDLQQLQADAQRDLAAVTSAEQLETFRIKYLGTRGQLKAASDFLRSVPPEEKRVFGQQLNALKQRLSQDFESRKAALEATVRPAAPLLDVTEPGRLAFTDYQPGVVHVISQTIDSLTDLFGRMAIRSIPNPKA